MNHGWMNVSPPASSSALISCFWLQRRIHQQERRRRAPLRRRHAPPPPTQPVGVCTYIFHLLGRIVHYDELDPTGKCPRESGRKVAASCQNKLSSNRQHCIIDSMLVDSFNERLIMDNRLNENDGTYVKYSQLGQTASERIATTCNDLPSRN